MRWLKVVTVERVGLIVMAIGLFYQHRQLTDAREAQREAEVEKAAAHREKLLAMSPRPVIEGPPGQVSITSPEKLFSEAGVTLRNVGHGAAHDLSVKLIYSDICLEESKHAPLKVQRGFPVREGIHLAAGERIAFNGFPMIAARVEGPQAINGVFVMRCRDDLDNELTYMQEFSLLFHLTSEDPHAHLTFSTPHRFYPALDGLPNGAAPRLDFVTREGPDDRVPIEYVRHPR